MAGPVAGLVQLPSDSGNTGKKIQTQSEVIGADTVHAHYFVPRSRRKILGLHRFVTALQSVQASAQNGTSTGFWWMQVPSGAAIRARLRRLSVEFSMVTELDHLTVPRIALAKTASGAVLTPMRRHTSDAAPVADIRTAVTGMTVSLGALGWSIIAPSHTLTTSGVTWNWSFGEMEPQDEEAFPDIGPAEGLLLYQPDAGTASDGRRFGCSGLWDEYDNA